MSSSIRRQIRTPFREIIVEVHAVGAFSSSSSLGIGTRALLTELFFEFRNRNPDVERALVELHRSLYGFGPSVSHNPGASQRSETSRARMERDLERAFNRGSLILLEAEAPRAVGRRNTSVGAAVLGPEPIVEEVTTFIAFQLLDQDGDPVPGRAYQVVLPDGEIRTGRTGPDGAARIEGFAPDGTAKISFPDFDDTDFGYQEALPGARGADQAGPATPS